MAHHKSAIKRAKKNIQEKHRNIHYKSTLKTTIKDVLGAKEKDAAQSKFQKATSLLDKMVVKGIIHKNKAANQKSRLARHVSSIA